jgi:hypothetical protein
MTTIADIQGKFLAKMENKYKGAITKARLTKVFSEFDHDNDGFITLDEFKSALEFSGNSLSETEGEFLFGFWDTMAGQQEAQGAVQISLAVSDLLSTQPAYGGPFKSGDDGFKINPTSKSNRPSQEGGIFGGGSYEADAAGDALSARRGAAAPPPQASMAAAPSSRPKGNQPSVPGGIFAPAAENVPGPQSTRSNKSNQSSIAGGIFGSAEPLQAPAPKKFNSNASSVPGGIFG